MPIKFLGNENPNTILFNNQTVKKVVFLNDGAQETVWGKYNVTLNCNYPEGLSVYTIRGDIDSPAKNYAANRILTNNAIIFYGETLQENITPEQGFDYTVSYTPSKVVTQDTSVTTTVSGIPYTLTLITGTAIQSMIANRTLVGEAGVLMNATTGRLISGSGTQTATCYYQDKIQLSAAVNNSAYQYNINTITITNDTTLTINASPRVAQAPTLKWLTDTWNTGGTRITRPLLVSNPNNFSITIQFIIDILGGTIQFQSATIPASGSSTIVISVTSLPDTNGETTAQYRNSVVSTMQGSISISNAEKINYQMPSISIPARSVNNIIINNPNNKSGTYNFMITCEDSASSVFVDEWVITGTVQASGNTTINVNDTIIESVGSTVTATGPFRLEGTITIDGTTFNYLEEQEMEYVSS